MFKIVRQVQYIYISANNYYTFFQGPVNPIVLLLSNRK